MPAPTYIGRTSPSRRSSSLLALVAAVSVAALATGLLIAVVASMPARAALPGENGRIAFVSQRDGNEEIYVMKAAPEGLENQPVRLTNNESTASTHPTAGRDLLPSFLPGGSRVAFTSRRPVEGIHDLGGVDELYVMDAEDRDGLPEGNNLMRITGDAPEMRHNFQSAFSADGKQIVFTSQRDGNNEIYVTKFVDANGTEPAHLTEPALRLTYTGLLERLPAFSPEGTKVAFTRIDGNEDIWVMNADGTGQTNLTNNAATDTFPNFSPDGSKIVFSSNRKAADGTTDSEIYVMNATGGSDLVSLTNNRALDESPVFSPDGNKIAFTSTRNADPNDTTTDKEIWVMNADGSGPKPLTNNSVEDSKPDWGPIYAWSGVLQPINGGATTNRADDTSIFNEGRTVPVKFKLISVSAGVTNAKATLEVTRLSDAISGDVPENPIEVTPTMGNEFRYDDESDQYIYNWSTKGLEPGTYRLTIDLGDGTAENPDAINHVLVSLK